LTPLAIRWLYSLFLAEDANFKQKARARSNIDKDPPLGPGWGTFVENEAYLQQISTAPNKTEVFFLFKFVSSSLTRNIMMQISHCVGFAAMWNANSKRSEGLRATGIGAVIVGGEEEWVVEEILDSRMMNRKLRYQTAWVIFKRANGTFFSKDFSC
jgi:KDZ transposase-like protein